MEDALKNIGIKVQKDKVDTEVVFNFLFCDRINGKISWGMFFLS